MIQAMAGMFLGEDGNRRDPLANPLYADLAGLPPMYIHTGADETLLDDSRKLAELARKSGVDVTLEVVPEMQHVFHSWPAPLRKVTRRSYASLTGAARSWGWAEAASPKFSFARRQGASRKEPSSAQEGRKIVGGDRRFESFFLQQ